MAAWRTGVRPCLVATALAAMLLAGAGAIAVPAAGAMLTVDIPAQPLSSALAAFAEHTGLQLIYLSQVVEGQMSKGARAGLPHREALAALLDGTGLDFEFLNERTVRVYAPRPTATGASPEPREPPAGGAAAARGPAGAATPEAS